jgi:hypothetical protein
MASTALSTAKQLLRPIAKYRFLIERAKFIGTPIADAGAGNDYLRDCLAANRPTAAGKIGEVELGGLLRRLSTAQAAEVDWGRHIQRMYLYAGVYPPSAEAMTRFCSAYSQALGDLDVLGVWFRFGENRLRKAYAPNAKSVLQRALEPYFHERPWSAALEHKRVLVITPFADTVRAQYARRERIWPNSPSVLPEFHLDTLRCPLSAALTPPRFPDWSTALEAMQAEMSRREFDVVLVGAGAWGLPLVAYAKRLGRSGIHLGGSTQILFGIRGARWDDKPAFQRFFNDAWVRPDDSDRPENFLQIENGCYW